MNTKRWLFATLAGFVVYAVLQMVLHGMLLGDLYKQTASVWRPEAQMHSLMWLLWLSYLIAAAMLAFIYAKGYEPGKSSLGQGVRFGVYAGILIATLMSLGSYFSLPVPGVLALYWFIGWLIITVAVGAAIGVIYRR